MEEELNALAEAADMAARFIAENTKATMIAEASMAKTHAEAEIFKARHQSAGQRELHAQRLQMVNEQLRLAQEFDAETLYERLMDSIRHVGRTASSSVFGA